MKKIVLFFIITYSLSLQPSNHCNYLCCGTRRLPVSQYELHCMRQSMLCVCMTARCIVAPNHNAIAASKNLFYYLGCSAIKPEFLPDKKGMIANLQQDNINP